MKKTVVVGASPNPSRYSHMATLRLGEAGHEVLPLGIREGNIGKHEIVLGRPEVKDVDTVTLYVGPQRQADWLEYIVSLEPKRVIFNPGTESGESQAYFESREIATEEACTLVLLQTNQY